MQRNRLSPVFLRRFQRTTLALAIAALFAPIALANPVGPTVANGQATITAAGNTLNIVNTPGTIINWQQFNIGQNEITRFIQQSNQSAVLNRVTSLDPSNILGTLQSNGRVFLVNPNGIAFGQNAVIDVFGLTASTLNISNSDFLANRFNFNGGGVGAIVNQGQITTPVGGSVYLIGNQVKNEGIITSPQGEVLLAAGSSVSLADTGTPNMSVTLTANGNKAVNLGSIGANGGHIDIYGALIDQQGIVRADSASIDAQGRIVLKATQATTVAGEISAKNSAGQGGQVQILGDGVTLAATAKVDVSGASGGGTVLVGGDYQGKNAAIQNATTTTIAPGASLQANATDNGNGGKVIIWANDKTYFNGSISARGGANGGDGGFVETSGHHTLNVEGGFVDTRAPKGKIGSWLLDPQSICYYLSSSTECSPSYPATNPTSVSGLNATLSNPTGITITADDYIAFLPAGGTFTASITNNSIFTLTAPYIFVNGTLDTRSSTGLQANFIANQNTPLGTLPVDGAIGVLDIGSNGKYLGTGGSFDLSAYNALNIAAGSVFDLGTTGTSQLEARSITVTSFGSGGYGKAGAIDILTNKISGTPNFQTDAINLKNYLGGGINNILFGIANTDARCGVSGLCITNQLTNATGLALAQPTLTARATANNGSTYGLIYVDPNNENSSVGNLNFHADTFVLQTTSTNVSTGTQATTITINAAYIDIKGSVDAITNNKVENFNLQASGTSTLNPTKSGVIDIESGYTLRTPGSVTMNASKSVNIASAADLRASSLSITSGDQISIYGSVLSGGNVSYLASNGVTAGGVSTASGSVTVTSTSGDINIPGQISAAAGTVTLLATTGSVYGSGTSPDIIAAILDVRAGTNIYGAAGLHTRAPQINRLVATNGYVNLLSFGGVTLSNVSAYGNVSLTAQSPITINGSGVTSSTGSVSLNAANSGVLTLNGPISALNGSVTLAGGSLVGSGVISSPNTATFNGGSVPATNTSTSQTVNQAVTDTCVTNPTLCQSNVATTAEVSTETTTVATAMTTGTSGSSAAVVTYDAKLSVESKTDKDKQAKAEKDKQADGKTDPSGKLTYQDGKGAQKGKAGDKGTAAKTEERKVQLALLKRETKAGEARKTATELKKEAREVQAEAKKSETETKKAEAESKKADADVKKAETSVKKVEAESKKVAAEAKKAESTAKKADAEAKQHDAEAKKAEAESKEAKTPERKAVAEAKKADAESKKADAEGRKSEAESKKVEADSKKVETESKKVDVESKKAEAEAKKVEVESKKAETDGKKAEAEHKLAVAEAKEAKTPAQKAAAEKKAEEKRVEAVQKKAEAEVKKERAEAKKAEAEAKHSEAEAKKVEAEAKKVESDSKKVEADSKKSEAQAKKSESDSHKAEADSSKAKEGKKPDQEKQAEERKSQAEKKQAESEKKAEQKKVEAEQKKVEAEQKKAAAEQQKAAAEQKKVAYEKKVAEQREQAVKAFAKAVIGAMSSDELGKMAAVRHEFKTETLKPALTILASNAKAADLPACGGGTDVCVPTGKPAATAQAAPGAVPTLPILTPVVAHLPQIQRKVAVMIGINEYADKAIPALDSAVGDATEVGNVLKNQLGYDVKIIPNATKADIVRGINAAAASVGPNDSVTVYYAGHGYLNEKTNTGYWIPADASTKDPGNWVSNTDIAKLLSNIPAKQVMLVSDSCYSGALTREAKVGSGAASADPANILAKRSVTVMSSGGEEPVSDEGRDGHSIFAWNLMNALKGVNKFEPGAKTFETVQKGVVEEFPQVPQYGAATSAGHTAGGDYFFETRSY